MTNNEGLKVSQEGVAMTSEAAQPVQNGKSDSGGHVPQPVLNADLLKRVLSPGNLQAAWKQVRRNKGAAGVDGITIEDYPHWAKQHWPAARRALEGGYYVPHPVKYVVIPKQGGGSRLLGIATVNDRVIQQAINQVLTPIHRPDLLGIQSWIPPWVQCSWRSKAVKRLYRRRKSYRGGRRSG